jgi:hypothetical protein
MNKVYYSERTAIVRKFPSKPIQILAKLGLIVGDTLYHGRGKDFPGLQLIKDAVPNNKVLDYEPSDMEFLWMSQCPTMDTILSIYVLNVIDSEARNCALAQIFKVMKPKKSWAYFAVRGQDIEYRKAKSKWTPYKDGYISPHKTFQKFYTVGELKADLSKWFHTVEIIQGTDKSSMIIARARRDW